MKLEIELVPQFSWFNNMRKVLPKTEWDKLRKETYKKYEYKCAICGERGRLNCHEMWKYDDKKHIQKLIGFISLCDLCHHVKHIGFAQILADRGKLDFYEVIKHFMMVNKCDRETFENYRYEVFLKWQERSEHSWEIDLGEYKELIKE